MVPCFLASPVLSSASDSAWIGLWAPQVSVPGLPTSDREYLGAPLTLPVVQCFYNPATELQNQQESRRFILDRSVFDLVEAHVFLSLTDSRLLNWYLSLCPEDKRIVQAEGSFRQFLQRHPALELTRHHVYVKYSSRAVQQTVTSSRSVESGAKTTGCEPAHTHLDVEMFRRDFSAPGCRNTSGDHLCEELSQRSLHLSGLQDLHLQDSLPWTSSSSVTERPGLQQELSSRDQAVLAGLSLDLDLDLDTCSHRPETRSHISAARDQNVTCCEARPSHSDRPAVNKEPSEYVIQTSGSSVGSENNRPENWFSDQHQTRNIHSIMEDDGSILVCSPSCLQSDGPQKPSEVTCDVSVGTELLPTASTFTQTEHPETADQQVITEVHMSDLDCLAEEFIRLKTAQVQKEKIKRRGGCDCTERAQKAELNLLGLQYNICRSHIWRLYWEGKQLSSLNKDPPANFTEVLDKLDSDYQDRKREVLAGVPLEQLKPLSVESGKEISGSYTPAQMFADQLGNVSCRTSAEPQQLHAAEPQQLHAAAEPQQFHAAAEPQRLHAAEPQRLHAAEPQRLHAAEPQQLHAAEPQQLHAAAEPQQLHAAAEPQQLHAAEPQQLHAAEPQRLHAAAEPQRLHAAAEGSRDQTKKKMIKPGRAASVILKDGSFLQNKQEGNQTAAAGEEGRSELWFDAEEDLDLPEEVLDLPEEDLDLPGEDLDLPGEDLDLPGEDLDLPGEDLDLPGEDLDLPEEDLDLPADGRESEGSVLKVSNPPSDVAMTLLKESEASGVRISALKDDQRVAMVTVKELDGGCTLHVDPPRPGPSENLQDPPRPGPSENLQDPPRPGPSENLQDTPRPGPSENLQDPPRPGPSENLQDTPRPGPSENLQDTPRPGPSENLQDPHRPGPSENLQDTPRPGPSENLQDTPRPGPSENLQDPPRPGPSENLQDPPRPGPRSPVRTPLPSSSSSRKVVFISPTTRGPCVPQHYGSMGSFDALMSELLQRHPEVGRQRLLDALEELRRKHPGVLTGLPLQTVREMTSQLLTRPDPASQI